MSHSTPPSLDRSNAHVIAEHWATHHNLSQAFERFPGGPKAVTQGVCEHVVKNILATNSQKNVVKVLDELEGLSLNINLHRLHQVCLAWQVHRPNPSPDMSALLLMRLMNHVMKHNKPITTRNSPVLSQLLSNTRCVDHMIDTLTTLHALIPMSGSILRNVVENSALHEKDGVCFAKWMAAHRQHNLFDNTRPAAWSSWSDTQKQQYHTEQFDGRIKELSDQMHMLMERYSERKHLDNPPIALKAWWNERAEMERIALLPPYLHILPLFHPITKLLAPYITLPQLTAAFQEVVSVAPKTEGNMGLLRSKQTENAARSRLNMALPHLHEIIQSTSIDDLRQCRHWLGKVNDVKTIKNGSDLWGHAASIMDQHLLKDELTQQLSGSGKPSRSSKL